MSPSEFRAIVERKAAEAKIPFKWLPDGNAMVIYPSQGEALANIINEVSGDEYQAEATGIFVNNNNNSNINDNNGGANDNDDNDNWGSRYKVTTSDEE